MTPASLAAWMTRLHFNKVRAASELGIARTTLDRYLDGSAPIPHSIALACATMTVPEVASLVTFIDKEKIDPEAYCGWTVTAF